MVRIRRTTTAVLVASLLACSVPVFADESPRPPAPAAPAPLLLNGAPLAQFALTPNQLDAQTFAQWRGRGRSRGRGGRNDGAAAALLLGAAATIAGAAVLVYANRPECSVSARNSGCGYGTKVVGGAVLSAGVIGMTIGAITWR